MYLSQVSHGLQVLHVQIITAVRDDDLCALAGQSIDHIAAQKACGAEYGGTDATHLHRSARLVLDRCKG